ncbi:hypothetical protein ACFLIM_08970 [Nonomuraea sp. M3C6]|uniref:Transketolase-like pyrimidine-binding domain-containing protein n=1 Tax=Nonomuraea marmarensis TaxID=3351344 RepID=A0ABW7AAN8_9ACTN
MPDLSYGEAVNAALHRLMEELPETLVYGEDVGVPGGVFGVTRGLRKQYGDRAFDTPISESAILGSAVGAAMFGRRPIVEIMWADFSLVALDQIVNQAANVRYVSAGRLRAPLTIRTQQGTRPAPARSTRSAWRRCSCTCRGCACACRAHLRTPTTCWSPPCTATTRRW